MRTLSGPAAAVIAGGKAPLVLLIEMDLTSSLFLNTSNMDLVIGGSTYYGTKGLGKIGAIQESPAEVKQLQFELSGVRSDTLALALSEPLQGKAVRIKTSILDPSTYAVLDTRLRWAGWLDVMTISDGDPAATISVTAEHAGIDLTRAASSLYSHDEQTRLHPGDLFFRFLADQVEQKISWPAAAWFKK